MTTGFDGNRALLSGELDWKQFIKPKDLLDLEDCRQIDRFNEGYVYVVVPTLFPCAHHHLLTCEAL